MSAKLDNPTAQKTSHLEAGVSPASSSLIKKSIARPMGSYLIPFLTLVLSGLGIWIAILSIARNTLEAYPVPLLGSMFLLSLLLFLDVYRQYSRWDFWLIAWTVLSFLLLLLLRGLPEYVTGLQLNVVIHRSLISAAFLMIVCLPVLGWAIFYLMGATPRAEDFSRYPLILLPVVLITVLYFSLIGQLAIKGLKVVNWDVFIHPYYHIYYPVQYLIQGDWPAWRQEELLSIGILNHLLGTGLLMLLTTLLSLPIGVGAGLFFSEYGDNWVGRTARLLISSLRAISLLVLGISAFSLAYSSMNSPLAPYLRGTYFTGWETVPSPGGSYLTASIVLSLLIIPVIARVTEEGCRSLPLDLREGSVALGVSESTTLRRIVLPWSLPNIITAVLLGNAEVAGSVAVLMFISGRGEYGVGIFKQVTSLAYLIFDIYFGDKAFREYMLPYQYQAGLVLLLICLGLGIAAIASRQWLTKWFRGG
jgi:phosphate transport system permease protein